MIGRPDVVVGVGERRQADDALGLGFDGSRSGAAEPPNLSFGVNRGDGRAEMKLEGGRRAADRGWGWWLLG